MVKSSQATAHDGFVYVFLFCHRIDILNFDKCLHVFLKHACEERLQLVAAEVLEDLSPLGRLIEIAQVRPHVAAQNAEGRRLANTVGAHETEYLTSTRHR